MCGVRGVGGLFKSGWGDVSVPLSIYHELQGVQEELAAGRNELIHLDITLSGKREIHDGMSIQEGSFPSPQSTLAFKYLPQESKEGKIVPLLRFVHRYCSLLSDG